MSERYNRIFTLPGNLYVESAPIIIAAGALLKDTETGKILAQLKFKSISPKPIKAIKVKITPMDTIGKIIGDEVLFDYLDLNEKRDAEFGQKKAIPMPNDATRSFTAEVVEVVFSDNTVWELSGEVWDSLEPLSTLNTAFGDIDLVKQYRAHFGEGAKYYPQKHKTIWFCTCGSINNVNENACHSCNCTEESLFSCNIEELKKETEERVEKEKIKQHQKTQKRKKIITISVSAIILCIALILLLKMFFVPNRNYKAAVALFESGKYEESISAFEELNGFRDSTAKIQEAKLSIAKQKAEEEEAKHLEAYEKAVAMLEAGKYEEAVKAFGALGNYSDSVTKKAEAEDAISAPQYAAADSLYAKGDIAHAAMMFYSLGDYRDSRERSFSLWDKIAARNTISANYSTTIGLKNDGTVVAIGNNSNGQCDTSNWTDIIAVDAGANYTVGLKRNGTVVAAGSTQFQDNQILRGWSNVISIAMGSLHHALGLKADGTVIGYEYLFGDGKESDWTDIVAIAAAGSGGNDHIVGLKADGTVVAAGENYWGQCNVSNWRNIIAIAAGKIHTVGLRADGTVVATSIPAGKEGYFNGQCDVSNWTDIVAISAGDDHTVGLKKDGTVVSTEYIDAKDNWFDEYYGQCEVSNWTDIVAIAAGGAHTVGLKADGTVVAVGRNTSGQCNVSKWKGIMLPLKKDIY